MQKYVNRNLASTQIQPVRQSETETSGLPNSVLLGMLGSLSSSKVNLSETMTSKMEERFGVPLSGLRVYEDSGIKDLGKLGYARGNEVHISDDLKGVRRDEVLSHEIGHVVQQGAGMVRGIGMVNDTQLENRADTGFMVSSGAFSMPASTTNAPVQGRDNDEEDRVPAIDETDAAAEKRGFAGGLGRRLANPFRFVGRTLLGLKHSLLGFSMSDDAMKLASEQSNNNGEIGDAEQYAGTQPSGSAKALGVFNSLAAPAATLGLSVSSLAMMSNKKVSGGLDAVNGAMNAVSDITKGNLSSKGGNRGGANTSYLQAGTDIADAVSGGLKVAGFASNAAGTLGGSLIPGAKIIGGGFQMAKGKYGYSSGKKTESAMSSQIKALNNDSDTFKGDQRRSLLRSMHMAREVGAVNKEAGAWDVAAGALKTAGGAVSMTGAGAALGTGLSTTGTIVGVVGGINKSMQISDMRERIVEQELGLQSRIEALDEELESRGIKEKLDTATKERIVLQRMGYKSGTRNEVFMNIAMNRSKMLTDMANNKPENLKKKDNIGDDVRGEDKYNWTDKEKELHSYRQRKFARQTLKSMGLEKVQLTDEKKGYSQQGTGEKLGMDAGIDINYQLQASKGEGELEKAQRKLEEEIKKYEGKRDNASFGFTRRHYEKKLGELQNRKNELSLPAGVSLSDKKKRDKELAEAAANEVARRNRAQV